MVTRVTDLANNRLIQSLIFNAQDKIQDRQLQLSTMQKSQDYAGIAKEASKLLSAEASEHRIDQFLNDNSTVNLRMDATLNSIDFLKNSLNDARGLVREILDDGNVPDGMDKDDISATKMSEIQDFLNVKINGRYLFAGSMTSTQPVVPNSFGTAPTFDSSYETEAEPAYYYKGDDNQIKARISENVTLDYGVNADDPGFEKLIRAVRIIRETALSDANASAKFDHALALLNESEDRLQAIELNIGVKVEQLARTNESLTSTKNSLGAVITDIEQANTFEAVAELTQTQTMLEASYNTVVRLSDLTLNRFLR